ncbi:MAG: hypothetical protein IIW08_03265 [Clostridia bacterium]|nr:hypothetical protein [Clostridia bacterium]
MTRRMKTALCVLLVAAILTTAVVVLLSGSGNGYETVFRAGVKSLFEADSKTVKITYKLAADGETEEEGETLVMIENGKRYEASTDRLTGETREIYEFPDKRYSNIDHENKTYELYDMSWNSMPQSEPEEDPAQDTLIRIVKLFSDFFMGNAKNQFVREPMDGGNRYVLMLKTEQMPDLVNLLVNLVNETEEARGLRDSVTVEYMDKNAAIKAYYKKLTGDEIDGRVMEHYSFTTWDDWAKPDNERLNDAYFDFKNEMEEMYHEAGENVSPNACVFVNEDGTYEVYASQKNMYARRLLENLPLPHGMSELVYPSNLTIEYFRAEFEVSDEGYITHISLKGEVSVQDVLEKTHTGTLEAEIDIDAYNTTKITLFDVDAYTNKEREAYVAPETDIGEAAIEFLGETYEVNYTYCVEE